MAGGVLVDANVLLDILTADPQWLEWSSSELRSAKAVGEILVNPIICAEIAPAFEFEWSRIDAWLAQAGIEKVPLPFEASVVAAAAHRAYRNRGGSREKPLPDFFIGAHAEVAGCKLLTRDAARYWTYFPSVPLICPL
jgi:predicted nucleic acid-binding protein